MRLVLAALALLTMPAALWPQAAGRFPPDSLINVQVFPRTTPVAEVTAAMRSFANGLGVRCQFCHVGEEGMPLDRFDFASDEKRTKLYVRAERLILDRLPAAPLGTFITHWAAGPRIDEITWDTMGGFDAVEVTLSEEA